MPASIPERSADARDVGDRLPVRHRNALGPPGGSRRVDHIGEIRGVDVGIGLGPGDCPGGLDVEQDNVVGHGGELVQQAGGRDERRHGAVVGHHGEAFGGLLGVERHVGGPGLEHPEHRGGQLDRLLHQHTDAALRTDAHRTQASRDPVGRRAELRVRRAPPPAHHGDGIGNASNLPFHQAVQRQGRRLRGGAAGRLGHLAPALPGAGEDDLRKAHVRVGRDLFDQDCEPVPERLHGRSVEQGCPVGEGAVQAVGRGFGVEREVAVRLAAAQAYRLEFEAGLAGEKPLVVLQCERRLEHRSAAGVPGQCELRDDPLEGNLLALVGLERDGRGAPDQGTETRVTGRVDPQRHGVDEHADELLGVGVAAARHRGADGEVVLAAPPAQQRVVGGEQHDEGRGPGGPGERFDGDGALAAEPESVPAAGIVDLPGSRPVGRQVEHRHPGETGAPGLEVGAALGSFQPVAQPPGDVAVPHRQRREFERPVAGLSPVVGPQVAQQQARRGTVADDVVHRE